MAVAPAVGTARGKVQGKVDGRAAGITTSLAAAESGVLKRNRKLNLLNVLRSHCTVEVEEMEEAAEAAIGKSTTLQCPIFGRRGRLMV